MNTLRPVPFLLLLATALPVVAQGEEDFVVGGGAERAVVAVPEGRYRPLLVTTEAEITVPAFRLDAHLVTRGDYLAFVREHPEWRRDEAAPLFVGGDYLAGWPDALDPGGELDRPVTEVSWFAARAFCRARGGRLPTTDEWEYVAGLPEAGSDTTRATLHARFLALHQQRPRPGHLPPVGQTVRNVLGVHDMHGVVWEWTADFNNQMLTGAGRNDRSLDRGLFCAAGSVGVPDPSDYAAFLRSSHRATLNGSEGGLLLGFRCAYPE